jgi:hypothetical protein
MRTWENDGNLLHHLAPLERQNGENILEKIRGGNIFDQAYNALWNVGKLQSTSSWMKGVALLVVST